MRVVETSDIFFREFDDEIVDPHHLWDKTHQLDVLNHLEVSLTSLFEQPSGRYASYNHSYIFYGQPRTLVLPLRKLLLRWVHFLLADEILQLSLPDESFNLLLQVVAVGCVMTVITMEAVVLVSRPLIRISLQFARKNQGSFVLNLHQDLVDWGNQQGEVRELPCRGLGAHVLSPFSSPSHLTPPIRPYVFLSFSFLGLLFSSQ